MIDVIFMLIGKLIIALLHAVLAVKILWFYYVGENKFRLINNEVLISIMFSLFQLTEVYLVIAFYENLKRNYVEIR